MKRLLGLSLFVLLFCHALATSWVSVGMWWQEQRDLSHNLSVYSSVDSIVEFQVVLGKQQRLDLARRTSEQGFTYHGSLYDVVSIELRDDTLYITALPDKGTGLWQQDLLSFIKQTLSAASPNDAQKKAHTILKLLLKDYHLSDRINFSPHWLNRLTSIYLADVPAALLTRALAVMSPPPRG